MVPSRERGEAMKLEYLIGYCSRVIPASEPG